MNPPGAFAAKPVERARFVLRLKGSRLDHLSGSGHLRWSDIEKSAPLNLLAQPPACLVGFDYRLLTVGRHSIFLWTANSCPCAFQAAKTRSRWELSNLPFANLLCALWSDEKSGTRFLVLSNTQYAAD